MIYYTTALLVKPLLLEYLWELYHKNFKYPTRPDITENTLHVYLLAVSGAPK